MGEEGRAGEPQALQGYFPGQGVGWAWPPLGLGHSRSLSVEETLGTQRGAFFSSLAPQAPSPQEWGSQEQSLLSHLPLPPCPDQSLGRRGQGEAGTRIR